MTNKTERAEKVKKIAELIAEGQFTRGENGKFIINETFSFRVDDDRDGYDIGVLDTNANGNTFIYNVFIEGEINLFKMAFIPNKEREDRLYRENLFNKIVV